MYEVKHNITVKIYNVDSTYRDYEITENELVDLILGDDFGGAPPRTIELEQLNDDGEKVSIVASFTK